jgi:hypothetical protein
LSLSWIALFSGIMVITQLSCWLLTWDDERIVLGCIWSVTHFMVSCSSKSSCNLILVISFREQCMYSSSSNGT